MKTLTSAITVLLLGASAVSVAAMDGKPAKPEKPAGARKPVYDEKADARKQIDAALAAARRENRRVLIQWGADWCPWCVLLHERFGSDRNLAKELRYEYDVVLVDVGKKDKNVDLATHYGADVKKHGIPFLTVLGGDGKVLANQSTEPFEIRAEGKRSHDGKKLLEFLHAHEARPVRAEEVLARALAAADRSGRNVFLHFGAPWCGWCLRLDAWLARPDVAAVLSKDFVEVKVDLDRMTGAKEVFNRYHPAADGGVPWFALLDARGKAIVTSDGPDGNIGFPAVDKEIAYFAKMLAAGRRHISDSDIESLRKTLMPSLAKG